MVTDGRVSTRRDFDAVAPDHAVCIRARRFWRAACTRSRGRRQLTGRERGENEGPSGLLRAPITI